VASLNKDKVREYVDEFAKQVNVAKQDKKVQEGSNQVLQEGREGRSLAIDVTVNQLVEQVEADKSEKTIALEVTTTDYKTVTVASPAAAITDGKSIGIDLSRQMLYAYENGQVVYSSAISSGLPATPTPRGTYRIFSKSRSATMSGPGYYLPAVPCISRFVNGYSIHGTYWHSNFGHPMSHGCVNLPTPSACWVFDWAPMGTPVVVW
jgi:lipoprotein-anchoring transpeptidase ErfK/SrfK